MKFQKIEGKKRGDKQQKFAHVIKYLVTDDLEIVQRQAKYEQENLFFDQVIYMNK